jgi:HlyD family secretion protein
VLVEEGDMVEEGQVLMRLDPTAFAADVARVQALVSTQEIDIQRNAALLTDLQRQLQRQQQLLKVGLVQQEVIDSLQNQVDVARINVTAAQAALRQSQASLTMVEDSLRKTIYRAPIAGLLAGVDIKPGETVIAGTTNIIGSALMTLADPSAILAELRVDEADIANVYLGQQAKVFAAAYPRQAIHGEVIQIATSARAMTQNQSLSFRVKVLLQPDDLALFSGMSCRAELVLKQQQDSIQIPIAAVQRHGNTAFVWLVENDKAVKRPVELGMATDTAQQILSGLTVKQSVIVGPARTLTRLTEGSAVNATRLASQEL